MGRYAIKLVSITIIMSLITATFYLTPTENEVITYHGEKEIYSNGEWIIKWKDNYSSEINEQAYILDWLPEQNTMRVKLKEDTDFHKWISRWENSLKVEYIHPNYDVTISEAPNDSFYSQQHYLQQINAELGWDEIRSSQDVVVAVLDTGVDLNHPDLKGNIVDGINLWEREKSPQDDNGHGTNVAGVLGATGNNLIGVTGVSWRTKIMPIKVLDSNGDGKSFLVGQGVRYAADNGAKVILLALGDIIYSPFMSEAVNYAESKGALVVAASGNDSNRLNYPAQFPNVLSVGAVDSLDKYAYYSNYGQQLDVVAPGEGIYTTKLGGDYTVNSGTSLAAPQVAGLAALMFQKNPNLTPKEVADIIKFTADDVEDLGWDIKTGYGRINVARALSASTDILVDGYEFNNTYDLATPFPIEDTFNAQISKKDVDWYKISLPYDGTVNINLQLDRLFEQGVLVELYDEKQIKQLKQQEELNREIIDNIDTLKVINNIPNQNNSTNQSGNDVTTNNLINKKEYILRKEQNISLKLPRGTTYIKLSVLPNEALTNDDKINYKIHNDFVIYSDYYEPNNVQWNAYNILNINQSIVGTLDNENDEDWYKIKFNKKGTLQVIVEVDTLRIDPVILIQPQNGTGSEYDYNGSGQEEFGLIDVIPGTYFIKVSDLYKNAVQGEYKLHLNFKSTDGDNNEPNDISLQSTKIDLIGKINNGIIADSLDDDWYAFNLEERKYISFDFGAENITEVSLYNNHLNAIWTEDDSNWVKGEMLEPGTYYIRLSSQYSTNNYSLLVKEQELHGGFVDIENHWAKESIISLYQNGIISGYDDYTFRPEQEITRGEVANILSQALNLTDSGNVSFSDVNQEHKYASDIAKVYNAKILTGYNDNTFRPEKNIRRDEVVVVLAKAFKVPISQNNESAFRDVNTQTTGFYEINTFYKYGLLDDFIFDNSFRPREFVTRAEFVILVDRLLKLNIENN